MTAPKWIDGPSRWRCNFGGGSFAQIQLAMHDSRRLVYTWEAVLREPGGGVALCMGMAGTLQAAKEEIESRYAKTQEQL